MMTGLKSLIALTVSLLVSWTALADESPVAPFDEVAQRIERAMQAHLFDPRLMQSEAYLSTQQAVAELAAKAPTREAFVAGFNDIWRSGPFSHVRLAVAQQSATALADYLDSMRIGGGGAVLTWENEIAILTVNTMMGLDTIEEIDAAYEQITRAQAKALIIDLRSNQGGAFAIRPLIAHLLKQPLDPGAFVSSKFTVADGQYPSAEYVQTLPPWEGWSIKAFWATAEENAVTRIRFQPQQPHYAGPVYVLISNTTASAAELAADALSASGRALLIGERSAGEMLSQKMYDVPLGLQISLPIADYYSFHSGRIEGKGIRPDLESPAQLALAVAVQRARKQPPPAE